MRQKENLPSGCSKDVKALRMDIQAIAQAASHQLKDPLRQAIIDIENLQVNYDKKPLDIKAKQFLNTITSSITTVINRIDQIREYSRLTEDKEEAKILSCDSILTETLESLSPLILKHHAIITSDTLPELYGKRQQLLTLFTHLITNALTHNESQPPKIHIAAQKADHNWEFAVSDNGIGLEEVYSDLVFALFQSLDHTKNYNGAGLAFCKRIIQNHYGKIWYTANEGQGTCFYFTIPTEV